MLKIYKYPIPVIDHFIVELPARAKPLRAQLQRSVVCIWFLLDPDITAIPRNFRVIGTGHPIPESMEELEFIDTFQIRGGREVYHLFEVKKTGNSN